MKHLLAILSALSLSACGSMEQSMENPPRQPANNHSGVQSAQPGNQQDLKCKDGESCPQEEAMSCQKPE